MASVDRINGLTGNLGIKAPVVCATTANITLSGLQTIDGITVVAGDRVLVKNQTTQTENGIYAASSTAWAREPDFDGNRDITTGTLVFVRSGTTNGNGLYKVTTATPIVVGTSNITFADAEFSSTAALAAQAAAEAAQAAAEVAQTAAELAETNAETAATTATTQAGIATTQASNASTSASTATTQAGIATTQAGLASGYATSAQTFAAANIRWTFDSSTTMADPGTGDIRLNNATLSSVTAIAIAETNADSANMATWIAGFDDATHSPRGYLTIKKNATNFVVYGITGANTDSGTWQQLTVTHQASLGSFSNGDSLYLDFAASGNDGSGSGDFSSNTSTSVDSEIVLFSGTGGKTGKRATGTGYVKVTSGVMGTPSATVPLTDLATQAANTILANATGSAASPTAVSMGASTVLGRDSTGNISALTLSGLTAVGGVLTASSTGRILQTVTSLLTTAASTTTAIPNDDTIPQNTEGAEYTTLAITPQSASSTLEITVQMTLAVAGSGEAVVAALFVDSTADALAVGTASPASNITETISYVYRIASSSTSARTYKVRYGCGTATAVTVNGTGGARKYGGVLQSGLIIKEIL